MDPIIPAFAVSAAVFASYKYFRRFLRLQQVRSIAIPYLHRVKISPYGWGGFVLQGRHGPLQVLIAGSSIKKFTQVRVLMPGPPDFSEVSIRRENQTLWKTREIEVGSESFDKVFFVTGPISVVLALLDAAARSLLIRANDTITGAGSRLEIVDGELVAETAYAQLPLLLPLLLEVSDRFAHPVDVERRLAHNAIRDPETGVRLQNLLLLIREHPEHQRTLDVLNDACFDPSPKVRLWAGKALGTEGRPVLMKLTEDLADDGVSAEAVSLLEPDLPFEPTQAILLKALERHCPHTAHACLEVLSRIGGASAVDLLVTVMEQQQGEVAVFAAQALGTTGNPAAEGPLIRVLQSAQGDLRMAAANALGSVGSTAAVLPLEEAAELFSHDLNFSQATRQAIAEIQSRLPGASPGQISLAGAEAGQLSLAAAEAGQLSIAADPAGQLSLGGTDATPVED